ncbi:MAG: bifunctional glutamate N-acetyltransferase/amino-acid acetyltransferase ArgJ [Candidatus Acidiferrales bacterium]
MPRPAPSDIPKGFSFSAAACGLKKSRLDLALIVSETTAPAAAMFTKNIVQAAPVILCREHLQRSRSRVRAIVVNAGNANCATGAAGLMASRLTADAASLVLGCKAIEVLVCSTGVIGVPLRVDKIIRALPGLWRSKSSKPDSFSGVTRAIMTTDTRPKWAAAHCRIGGKVVRLLGCAKGSGMIQPNMATMLAFIVTDAELVPADLSRALRGAVRGTFNAITVDGDTSTNDTVALLANGASDAGAIGARHSDFPRFTGALEEVCRKLALAIVEDGEGAQRVVEIEVRGARTERDADSVARTIANSPLVKTALAGGDPNWGRILAAAGRAGVRFDPARVHIHLAGTLVCRNGLEVRFSERTVRRRMLRKFVPIRVHLRGGNAAARILTCDLTKEYIHINASYRT